MPSSPPSSRSDGDGGALADRFALARRRVDVGGRAVEMLHPAHADALIDEAEFDRDERLPYWADIWPSSVVLAQRIASMPGGGRSLLELGCGVGLVAVAGVGAGFATTATDYDADALAFATANVRRATGMDLQTRVLDWRAVPADVGRYDVVVASDVLYEGRYPPLVAAAIARTLALEGEAIIADPGRLAAPLFPGELGPHGLELTARERVPYAEGTVRQTIELVTVRWRR
jgi:predicted nicotinamide N-methyase